MACEDKCAWVVWEADRPKLHSWGLLETRCEKLVPSKIPKKILDDLYSQIMNENSSVKKIGCPKCDCEEVGKRKLVLTTRKLRSTKIPWSAPNGRNCTIMATFKVRLRKWRIAGECAPKDVVGV